MKQIIALAAGIGLVACTITPAEQSAPEAQTPIIETPAEVTPEPVEIEKTLEQPAPTYNEEVWYISGGWPGEYPPGLSVLDSGVVLMGREHMHSDAAQSITCPVPQFATYQQWNTARVEADELEFVTVSERVEMNILKDTLLDAPTDADWEHKLALSAGDVVTYLRYLGEGWLIMEHEGTEYDVQEGSLYDVSDINSVFASGKEDQLWINIPCGDDTKSRAWIELDQTVETDGIALTPIMGYGESRDLTEQDRIDAIAQTRFYLDQQKLAAEDTDN